MGIGDSGLGVGCTPFSTLSGQKELKDNSTNWGERPWSVALHNASSIPKCNAHDVIGAHLEKSTNLFLLRHVGSHTWHHPIFNHLNLLVELCTVFQDFPSYYIIWIVSWVRLHAFGAVILPMNRPLQEKKTWLPP